MTDDDPGRRYDTCGNAGGRKKNGGPCGRPAGWGTQHPGDGRCKLHFGNTESENRKAQESVARRECVTLGIQVETNPVKALIQSVREAAGNVEFYRQLVQQLPTHPTPAKRVEVVGGPDDGEVQYEPGVSGIYGPTYHVSGMPTGEAKPHVLVQLYNEERKRLADFATAALKANVEERLVQMAEADATRIIEAQAQALIAMGLGDRLEEFRGLFVNNLSAEPAHLGAASAS